jgi:hypothetical protein
MVRMIDVLVNNNWGGFTVSKKALDLYWSMKKTPQDTVHYIYLKRHDPILVKCFKLLGDEFDPNTAIQKIPAIYADYYTLHDNDGIETIVINHTQYDHNHCFDENGIKMFIDEHFGEFDSGTVVSIVSQFLGYNQVEVLMNGCYGGFGFSTKARELFCKKQLAINPAYKYVPVWSDLEISFRTNHILVECFKELEKEFNDRSAYVKIKTVAAQYLNYVQILDYDGVETLSIDMVQYLKDQLDDH